MSKRDVPKTDPGETVGDALKTTARSAVSQGAPEHLEQVLSGQQGVHYPLRKTCSESAL